MKTARGDVSGKKSQSALLRQLIRQAFISVGTGAVLLIGFIVFNIGTDQCGTVLCGHGGRGLL